METKSAIAALAALAQETRLAIFRLLVEAGPEGMPAGAIAEALGSAPATMSFHLKELVNAQLIASRQEGRFIYYRANFEQVTDLLAYLTRNCCARDGDRCVPLAAVRCVPAAKARSNRNNRSTNG